MNIKSLLLSIVLIAGLFLAWRWYGSTNPAEAVRRQVERLRSTASFAANEGLMRKESEIENLLSMVTPDVTMEVNYPSAEPGRIQGREQFREYLRIGRHATEYLKLTLYDVKVTLGPDSAAASVTATVKAETNLLKDAYWQELVLSFVNRDEGWLLNKVETVKTWGR